MIAKSVRKNYPVLKSGVFLNHAATAPVSYGTIHRMQSLCREMEDPLGKHFYQWLAIEEETRRMIAELLGTSPSEISITPNTSSALSIVANCIDFQIGDRVLVPRNEFPSNRYVWQNLRAKGVECTFFDLDPTKSLVELLEALDLTNVRLISISQVSYLTGQRHNLRDFGTFCKERKIFSCVDAIQAVGTFPIDLKQTPVDFFAGGAQKWLLGPIGCGYLYIKKELIDQVRVPFVGWTSVRYPESFDEMKLEFPPEATRFEPGLPNIVAIAGLNNSLHELKRVGWEKIFSQLLLSSQYLYEAMQQIQGFKPLIPDFDHIGRVVSFSLPTGVNPKKLLLDLGKKGITVTARAGYIRLSPHFYNTKEELDKFLNAIDGCAMRKSIRYPAAERPSQKNNRWILLNGATGTLGREIALYLAQKGFNIKGIGRSRKVLEELRKKIGAGFESLCLDFLNDGALEDFLQEEKRRYAALINVSGLSEAVPYENMDFKKLREMFEVNFFAPAKLMQFYSSRFDSENPIGILNVISGTGRVGYPLFGGFGASSGALWTLSESLEREWKRKNIPVTTFISPPMHSPMQKTLGRVMLRYFPMKSKGFDYAHAEEIARDAVEALFLGKGVVDKRKSRFTDLMNSLFPNYISNKIKKKFCRER
ncbi:MAG: aminotransferase class V-fold PLP-dependent enzyme [Candidatus Algichlamydia australiensis]|nr:aminotransferase class V-fold PLP-dependent enzyme [Chlamydiales bacterium]